MSKNRQARCLVHDHTLTDDTLAIAFHVLLAQIGWQTVQVLVIREYGMGVNIKEVVIPNTQSRQNNRDIFLEGRVAKVLIHGVCAF